VIWQFSVRFTDLESFIIFLLASILAPGHEHQIFLM
jgi:hypothetical protein